MNNTRLYSEIQGHRTEGGGGIVGNPLVLVLSSRKMTEKPVSSTINGMLGRGRRNPTRGGRKDIARTKRMCVVWTCGTGIRETDMRVSGCRRNG